MYYIVYILYVILYYNIYIIMFGGFPEWVPLEIIAGWFMEVANPEKKDLGYPHFRKPPFDGFDVSCREDMLFFPPRTYLR